MKTIHIRHPMHQGRALSLFDVHAPREKGSREWNAFNAVRSDRVGAYRVAQPHKPLIVKGPRNYLRIILPPSSSLRGAHS